MLEGAERRTSMCQAYYCTFHLRERYIVQFTSVLCVTANQRRPADSLLRFTLLQYTIMTHFFDSIIKSKHPHTVDEYSHKSNERKTLTVLKRNSIIIVNCSAEYI